MHDRDLQEREPRCASSLFLLTAKAHDIHDYKVRWSPKPPRAPHIQKVSSSIPPGSSPALLCLWAVCGLLAVGCWLAVVAAVAVVAVVAGVALVAVVVAVVAVVAAAVAAAFGGASGHASGNGGWGYKMVLLSVHICYWCWWRCWCWD